MFAEKEDFWKPLIELKINIFRLPEVPPDTAETNTLMNVNALPEWSKVTPANVYRACGKLAILYETKLGEHCEKLQGKLYVINF